VSAPSLRDLIALLSLLVLAVTGVSRLPSWQGVVLVVIALALAAAWALSARARRGG
jgi:hypothetical protein